MKVGDRVKLSKEGLFHGVWPALSRRYALRGIVPGAMRGTVTRMGREISVRWDLYKTTERILRHWIEEA